MKKIILILLSCVIILSGVSQTISAEAIITEAPNIKIMIEGKQSTYSNTPIVVNGRTLLPLRETLINLGIKNDEEHIKWNQTEKSVTVLKDDTKVYLKVGDNIAKVNGSEIQLDAAPIIYKEKTYIPVRFVAQSLGKKVDWDSTTSTIVIKSETIAAAKSDIWTVKKDRPSGNEPISTLMKLSESGNIGMIGIGYKSSMRISGGGVKAYSVSSSDINKVVAIGSMIYMVDNDGKVKEYNPETDIWTTNGEIPSLEGTNGLFRLVSMNNKIYVVGANYTDIGEYDPSTKQYKVITKLPTSRIVGGALAVNNNIYIVGGQNTNDASTLYTLEMYDINADKWATKKEPISAASDVNMTYLNGKIYIIGARGIFLEYDISNDTWSENKVSSRIFNVLGMEAVNNKIYIIGQYEEKGKKFYAVQEYDPATNMLTTRASMNPKSITMGTTVLNGEIYTIDGSKVEVYTLPN